MFKRASKLLKNCLKDKKIFKILFYDSKMFKNYFQSSKNGFKGFKLLKICSKVPILQSLKKICVEKN